MPPPAAAAAAAPATGAVASGSSGSKGKGAADAAEKPKGGAALPARPAAKAAAGALALSNRRRQLRGSSVNTLICPPEKHISVESGELKAALKARLELADRARFDELAKLMEGEEEKKAAAAAAAPERPDAPSSPRARARPR
jgi:hypothetical protein